MHITMVKKRLASGDPCGKCIQAEELLRKRGLWKHVDQVTWAQEDDPESEGMILARQHQIELAPFFIVRDDPDGAERTYTSALRFIKQELSGRKLVPAPTQSLAEAVSALADAAPADVLRWALERHGAECGIAFSGAEDVVLIDMASKLGLPFSVFCLDTGRLHPETYRFIDRVREHYGITIDLYAPDAAALEPFVRTKGLFSFYEDGHKECCGVRKVSPLRRALGNFSAWITGQRRDQSPTRVNVPVLEADQAFEGKGANLLKLNPLAGWSGQDVWDYIRVHEVPYNELHDRGFASIGCEPCTRARRPGEHERASRWWWEESTARECGLHVKE